MMMLLSIIALCHVSYGIDQVQSWPYGMHVHDASNTGTDSRLLVCL